MFDSRLRPLIDPPLCQLARLLAARGLSANAMTMIGLATGLAAAIAVYRGDFWLALALILLSRLADGLDGPIARHYPPDTFGAYLDITCDFAFYAAIPLAFGLADPANTQAALVLLASFILSGTSFLASAILAEKKGWSSESQGKKGFYYLEGLAEGAETIAFFCLFCLWPGWFSSLAYAFACLCLLTALGRSWRVYSHTRTRA